MSQKLTIDGNTIIDAVISAITGSFPNVDVYDETINEGCEYPYFMVTVSNFIEKKLMRDTYLQTFIISVLYQYKSLPETSYSDFNPVGYKLADTLRLITLPNGEKVRGYKINFYPEHTKLDFYINYDVKVYLEQEPKPKQLHQNINVYLKLNESQKQV